MAAPSAGAEIRRHDSYRKLTVRRTIAALFIRIGSQTTRMPFREARAAIITAAIQPLRR